ncbi:hypothetical protein P9112_002128 [Eukaryota sp. TZLM1-RC]
MTNYLVWKEAFNDQGKAYYYNTSTRESQWDVPCEWKEVYDDDGKPFYYNSTTMESSWKMPREFIQSTETSSKSSRTTSSTSKPKKKKKKSKKERPPVSDDEDGAHPSRDSATDKIFAEKSSPHHEDLLSRRSSTTNLSDVSFSQSSYTQGPRQVLPHPGSGYRVPGESHHNPSFSQFPNQMPNPMPNQMPNPMPNHPMHGHVPSHLPDPYSTFYPPGHPGFPHHPAILHHHPSQVPAKPQSQTQLDLGSIENGINCVRNEVKEVTEVCKLLRPILTNVDPADESSSPLVLAQKLQKWGTEVEKMKSDVKEKKADNAFLRERLEASETKCSELHQAKDELHRELLLTQEEGKRSLILSEENFKKVSKELEIFKESFTQSRDNLSALRKLLDETEERKRDLETKVDSYERKIGSIEREYQDKIEELTNQLSTARDHSEYYEGKCQSFEKKLNKLKKESQEYIAHLQAQLSANESTGSSALAKAAETIKTLREEKEVLIEDVTTVFKRVLQKSVDKMVSTFKKHARGNSLVLDDVIQITSNIIRSTASSGVDKLSSLGDGEEIESSSESSESEEEEASPVEDTLSGNEEGGQDEDSIGETVYVTEPQPSYLEENIQEREENAGETLEEAAEENVEVYSDVEHHCGEPNYSQSTVGDSEPDYNIVEIPEPEEPNFEQQEVEEVSSPTNPIGPPLDPNDDYVVPFAGFPTNVEPHYAEVPEHQSSDDSFSETESEEEEIPQPPEPLVEQNQVEDEAPVVRPPEEESEEEDYEPEVNEEEQKEALRAALFEGDSEEDFDF